MEAGHSTAPRTVKRKIYGFQKNSLRSILEGGGEERRGRKKDTLEQRKESVQGRGSGCEKVQRKRERDRIRGEKDPTRARVSLPRIFERENRDSLNFRDRGRD